MTVIRFTKEILTDEHEDVADVLHQLEATGIEQAMEARPAPTDTHPGHPTTL
ncbi:hypothetical protein [Streptomyces albipurpureus]|uniref:Uncharacterized protein n=1 Tax=Streptomyces albipurpureus TaxID=2897419 RepID=A0ABT0UJF9_9ACTN|nr:hypothetical protein [Streptomyces sp. CWNU-1]MCM2388134.1 hypothetical protein [Streptomyces sp. CWNU-1]